MISEYLARITALPAYGLAALAVLVLYGLQAEIRFGGKARSHRAGPADRNSSLVLSAAAVVPIFGFVFAMKSGSPGFVFLPEWFRTAILPGLPAIAWLGVAAGVTGIALRLWAVLTLRERYTRTLLIQHQHTVERHGPYRRVRHPGYLGSLLCLNGFALASGNWIVFAVSLVTTVAAYNYRVRVEDEMLVAAFGASYDDYRREVRALVPW